MPTLAMTEVHATLARQGAAPAHHMRLDALHALCERSPHCLALVLVGSFAQGLGDRISDLDLVAFVDGQREAEFAHEADALIGREGVLNSYGQAQPGRFAFRKTVYLDFSSCEFHAFHPSVPFRLRRPYLALWDPHDHLRRLEVDEPPPPHETFEPYPHGDEGLVWELVDCIKWLQRGRTELAKRYLCTLGMKLASSPAPAAGPVPDALDRSKRP